MHAALLIALLAQDGTFRVGTAVAPRGQVGRGAIEVPAGRMLFASGQLGVSPDDHVPEDAEAQAVLCFENINAILAVPLTATIKVLLARSQRAAAAACDLAIVIAITEAVFAVTHAFWTPFTVVTVCYYFGGILTLGNSPGGWLVGRPRKTFPIDRRLTPMRPQPAESLHGTDNLRQFEPRHYTKAV